MEFIGSDGLRFPGTFDASIWAKEWLKTLKEHPGIATDEGTMIGWFANAIMRGYDRGIEDAKTGKQL